MKSGIQKGGSFLQKEQNSSIEEVFFTVEGLGAHRLIITQLVRMKKYWKILQQTKLINAFKVSGRNHKKLGIGVFNAITEKTQAVYLDSNGTKQSLTTQPFTNYNIVVFRPKPEKQFLP